MFGRRLLVMGLDLPSFDDDEGIGASCRLLVGRASEATENTIMSAKEKLYRRVLPEASPTLRPGLPGLNPALPYRFSICDIVSMCTDDDVNVFAILNIVADAQ